MMEWSYEVTMEFLNAYEGEPCIWDPQNADHKDRYKIYDAWKRIQTSLSIECSITELKKKKEKLMAIYRKLATKVKNSRESGAGGKEVYKPEWFAYKKMASFLHNIYIPRKPFTFDEGLENEQDDPSTPDPGESSDINDEESHDATAMEVGGLDQDGSPAGKKRRIENTLNLEKRLDDTYSLLKQLANRPKLKKDKVSLFCDLLCLRLRELDDDTREIAMHEINNLMFKLKKGNIQHTILSCTDSQQPGCLPNAVPPARSVDPVESPVDGSENSSSSSCIFSELNPPVTTTSQSASISNHIEMPCGYTDENNVFVKVEYDEPEIVEIKVEQESNPNDIESAAQRALAGIPEKSKDKYDLAYKKFEDWCEEKNMKDINENVLLTYFEEKKTQKASTLWTLYSMLRTELFLKKNIDIKSYSSLMAFLKRQAHGYKPKKSNVLSKENFAKFLIEMDDYMFLMAKVAMIIGVAGALGKSELTYLLLQNVFDEGSYFRVRIPRTATKAREFVITGGDFENINLVDIIRKYINLRPSHCKHNRFFVKYENGKCSIQPVGINTFGKLPKMIAKCIGLPNPVLFTGQCFRRSSATLLAKYGSGILKLK